MEYIPTRMTKVTTPKPAANPLQFVKVGPCDLFKSAQETLKKVEEVKKMKREVRDEAEEWQSNLDNWKCSRRKRVEHIIDRVVEVKKLELEEHERNRRKAKTFSEMMEERNSRGRKMSLLVHKDDDSNDLSDLGIGTSSDKSSVSEDYGNDDNHSVGDVEDSVKSHFIDQNGNSKSGCKGTNGINGGHDDDTSTSATVSSPEPEEYTYDRAIQGYVNFTETRVKSRTSSQISRTKRDAELVNGISCKGQNGMSPKSPPISPAKPRKECAKVEDEISDLERIQSRKYSGSSSDLNNSEKKVIIPKVDILKRKELFEKTGEASELTKIAPRAAGELANSKSIRDRVSNLERQKSEDNSERSKQVKRLSGEISVKDRLSLLEKQKSTEGLNKSPSGNKLNGRLSSSDLNSSSRSIKERLSSLEQSTTPESKDRSNKVSSDVSSTSIKSRLSELGTPKDSPKKLTADRDPTFHDKLANFRSSEADISCPEASKKVDSDLIDSSARSPSPDDIYHSKRHFHRSLDSLDVDTSSQISNEAFERVQSLEDLDSCGPSRNYPASASSNENLVFSSQSGDTDREDSGIHTADVSCSVSQADDPADIGDMNLPSCTSQLENENSLILDSENHSEHAPPMIVSQLEKITIGESSLPAEENTINGKQASQLEVINSKCPSSVVVSHKTSLQSGVLVDLTSYPDSQFNPASNTQNTSRSSNLSFLPCIPEVSHSTPVVVVIDTDPLTLTSNADVTSFPPITPSHDSEINFSHISPTDMEVVGEDTMSDSTECGETIKELLASQTGEDVLETEVHTLVEDFETLSTADVHKTLNVPAECKTSVSLEAFTVLEEALHIPLDRNKLLEEPVSTNVVKEDVAGLLTTEVSVDTDLGCYEDKGPKPFSSKYSFKDCQSPTDHVMGPLTSVDNDMDVSSFLDQALFEEDLKTTLPAFHIPKNEELLEANAFQSSHISEQHILYSIGTNEVLPSGIPLAFPLDTPSTAEPPKEKPPPPPIELSDDEEKNDFQKSSSGTTVNSVSSTTDLRRLDSTKRLKKEIRRKRSDFLGIEGPNDDSYLEPELKVAPPPDMTSFLQEERRLEQELYRQTQQSHYSESEQGSIQSEQLYHPTQPHYSESDQGSNQGESRDSGVELDSHVHSHAMHVDDSWGSKQPSSSPGDQSSEAHSRQNSEPFGNASTASEEDEIVKKEREIIEILEKEEQWRYGTNTVLSPSDHHQVGEKLAAKLRELEQEKMRLEWERAEEAQRAAAEQAARQEEQRLIRLKEQQLRQQESIVDRLPGEVMPDCDRDLTPEDLREERERLRREHAELERQRELLAANQADLHLEHRQCWDSPSSATAAHLSLQDVSGSPLGGGHNPLSAPSNNAPLNYRLSLPDLQQPESTQHSIAPRTVPHHRRPPPPIPPAKPLAALSQERQVQSGSSRNGHIQSSADALPLALDPQHHRHNSLGIPAAPTASPPTISPGSQQMSRQTLHALSAAPRSKIIATDTWVQAKRKPESQRSNNRDNYQHWLIQEAEHRRITEQQQRNAVSRKSLPTAQTQLQQSKIIPAAPAPSQQPQLPSQQWQYQNHQHQHPHHQLSHQHSHQQHPPQHPSQGAPPVPPPPRQEKPLPDAIIQTLTQRVQNRVSLNENNRRLEGSPVRENRPVNQVVGNNINNNINSANVNHGTGSYAANSQEKMLSVSGKKKCSHCNEELGRGAAMIIESLRLFYHMDCFKCCVCHVQLGDGLMGTDVRVRNHKLHCHNCYSSDDGVKFSCV